MTPIRWYEHALDGETYQCRMVPFVAHEGQTYYDVYVDDAWLGSRRMVKQCEQLVYNTVNLAVS